MKELCTVYKYHLINLFLFRLPTTSPAAAMAPPSSHSMPSVLGGVQQLQMIQPDLSDEEINDTFKVTFKNTSRKRALAQSYHCSGFKKICMVKFIHMPELSESTTDVSMSSTSDLTQQGSTQEITTAQCQLPSQPTILQYMTLVGSQQSFMSTGTGSTSSLTPSGDLVLQAYTGSQDIPQRFSTTGGIVKQQKKTIAMPTAGAFSTEVQLARAGLPPMSIPTPATTDAGNQPSGKVQQLISSLQMLFQDPFTVQPRKITKTNIVPLQKKPQEDQPETEEFGTAILEGTTAMAEAAAQSSHITSSQHHTQPR